MKKKISKHIDAFLKGQLSAKETHAFEQKIKTDPKLAKKVDLFRLEEEAVEVLIEQDLRQHMGAWKKGETYEPEFKRKPPQNPWLIGLIGIGLISLIGLFLLPLQRETESAEVVPDSALKTDLSINPATSTQEVEEEKEEVLTTQEKAPKVEKKTPSITTLEAIASKRHEVPTSLFFKGPVAGEAVEQIDTLAIAIEWYDDENWDALLTMMSNITPDHPDFFNLKEIEASAYFKNKEFRQAAEAYMVVKQGGFISLKDNANWNILLCLVAKNPFVLSMQERKVAKQGGFISLKDNANWNLLLCLVAKNGYPEPEFRALIKQTIEHNASREELIDDLIKEIDALY